MKNQILEISASLLLVIVFFVPIWSISLKAPQYPEGLGLYIYINKIEGHKESDLQSINGLNHYIGMKEIHPDDISELKIMPYFIIAMILLGIIFSIAKIKLLKYIWIGIFILAGAIGLYDFYMWEYNYGHDLDPRAIIKIPGMSYQPPLIGTKQLLNFEASSYPDIGFVIIFVSIFLMFVSLYIQIKNENKIKS